MELKPKPVPASFSMPWTLHDGLLAVMKKPFGTTWTSSLCDSTVWFVWFLQNSPSSVNKFNFHGPNSGSGDSRRRRRSAAIIDA